MPLPDLVGNWATWWQGDACGVLIFTPLILSWAGKIGWQPRRVAEAAALGVLLLGATQIVFHGSGARTFIIVPFVVWAAFRFGQRGVTTAVAVVCAMALWYTLGVKRGPFAAEPLHEALLLLLLFVATLVFTGLVLSAVLRQLERAMAELETRVRQRTAELEHATLMAERANEAKSQFLANMSHELRTPLNSLLILARLLADNPGGNLNPKQIKFAQTIRESGVDLLALINDLLDLAKIESGAVTALNVAPVTFREVRDDLERTFRQMAQRKAPRIRDHARPGAAPELRTDAGRLKQVLKNLLANAFKFTASGAVTLRIAPEAGGRVAFAVSDTGIGIAPDKQEVIFEAFRQADGSTSRLYGGTGLGLSISRELTRLLGGELRLASLPGQGQHLHARAAGAGPAADRAGLGGAALHLAGEQPAPRPQALAEPVQVHSGLARRREHLVLLLADVVTHVLAQHGEGGEVARVGGHVLELVDQHARGLVLDRRLGHQVRVADRRAHRRIEHLVFQDRVGLQLLAHRRDQVAAGGGVLPVHAFELAERRGDPVVVLLEQGDGIDRGASLLRHGPPRCKRRTCARSAPASGRRA